MLDGKAGKFSRATYNNKRLEIHNVLFLCEESTNFVQQAQFLSIQSVMIVQTGAVYWSSQVNIANFLHVQFTSRIRATEYALYTFSRIASSSCLKVGYISLE